MKHIVLDGETEQSKEEIKKFFDVNREVVIMDKSEYQTWHRWLLVIFLAMSVVSTALGVMIGYFAWGYHV